MSFWRPLGGQICPGPQRRTGMMLFLLTGKTPCSGRKHSVSLPTKNTMPTFMCADSCLMPSIGSPQHACGCCAKFEALAVQYLKLIAVQHAQVANNPLPVAGGVDPQIVENTRSNCPRKSYAKICPQNSVTPDRGLQPVCMHADCCAGSSRCGRAALQPISPTACKLRADFCRPGCRMRRRDRSERSAAC
jgi:hypothetical protein